MSQLKGIGRANAVDREGYRPAVDLRWTGQYTVYMCALIGSVHALFYACIWMLLGSFPRVFDEVSWNARNHCYSTITNLSMQFCLQKCQSNVLHAQFE